MSAPDKTLHLILGDSYQILPTLKSESVNLILTDPPYDISREVGFSTGGGWNNPKGDNKKKTVPIGYFGKWDKPLDLTTLITDFYRILKPHGTLIMFFDCWKMQTLRQAAEEAGFKQPRFNIWQKTNPVPVNSKLNYLSNSREYFVTFVKKGVPVFNSEYDTGLYQMPICQGAERTSHPTQKPLSLFKELVTKHTNKNDIVLDPFMGSGTTGVACSELCRDFIGIEQEELYYNMASKRIKV